MDAPTPGTTRDPRPPADDLRFADGDRSGSRQLLRFITCGSVDDGKSTLIGRLLHDSKLIYEDQLAALARDSERHGTTGDDIDLALLVDGLQAEREQGITIDVAYRFFNTPRRSFIVADTPGHEQYTRNMATGASTADLAVILVDARKGVLVQTRRHSFICSLLGIRHVVWRSTRSTSSVTTRRFSSASPPTMRRLRQRLGFAAVIPIPVSARFGDNVTTASSNTPWYRGPTLVAHLETAEVEDEAAARPFRFPVQWVNRPNARFPRLCRHNRVRSRPPWRCHHRRCVGSQRRASRGS